MGSHRCFSFRILQIGGCWGRSEKGNNIHFQSTTLLYHFLWAFKNWKLRLWECLSNQNNEKQRTCIKSWFLALGILKLPCLHFNIPAYATKPALRTIDLSPHGGPTDAKVVVIPLPAKTISGLIFGACASISRLMYQPSHSRGIQQRTAEWVQCYNTSVFDTNYFVKDPQALWQAPSDNSRFDITEIKPPGFDKDPAVLSIGSFNDDNYIIRKPARVWVTWYKTNQVQQTVKGLDRLSATPDLQQERFCRVAPHTCASLLITTVRSLKESHDFPILDADAASCTYPQIFVFFCSFVLRSYILHRLV